MLTGEGADELFAGYDYLREFTEAEELRAELERTVRSLHNLNLQRCDRVTMAHASRRASRSWTARSSRGRCASAASAKLAAPACRRRSCCARRSRAGCPTSSCGARRPSSATARGARDVLTRGVEAAISDEEFAAERGAVEPPLRTKEELAYYRVWREHLEGISAERTLSAASLGRSPRPRR